jgi:hypothetical protein
MRRLDMNDERIRSLFESLSDVAVPDDVVERAATYAPPRKRPFRQVATIVVALVVFAAAGTFVWLAIGPPGTHRNAALPGDTGATGVSGPSNTGPVGGITESISEEQQADIFAFRAVAAVGLMNPHGERVLTFTYADDTTRTSDGWKVGFAAADCQSRDGVSTCRGLSGEDPETGNAITDTYVAVTSDGSAWTVTDVTGNILPEEHDRLVGYTLPIKSEPSHWEFPAIDTSQEGRDVGYATFALWAGPYPTMARGSVCDVRALDAGGNDLGSSAAFYEEAPNREFERAGWELSAGIKSPPAGITAVTVRCVPYIGDGWAVASTPTVVRDGDVVVGVEVRLEWHGDPSITTPAVCHVVVADATGATAWTAAGRVEQMWPVPDPADYPYATRAFIVRPPDAPNDAGDVKSLTCTSL